MGSKGRFTAKEERIIKAIKRENKKLPKSKRANPFKIVIARRKK